MDKNNIYKDFKPVALSDLQREFFAEQPSDVDGILNSSAYYYRRKLLRTIFGRFQFDGMPETWDKDYFLTHLFLDGVICVTDTEVGVVPLQTGYYGINIYNHPTNCNIANPILGNLDRTIDEDCVLIKLQYDYSGIQRMLDRYSYMLASCDSAICVNLMNSKVTFIGLATSKAQAATMQKMYDQISSGRPAVFVKGDQISEESFFFNHVKESYIADDIQLLKRKLVNEFLTDIGINNANLDKRERLNSEEVNANNEEVEINIAHWLDNMREGFEKVKKLYNINISVRLKNYEGSEESESAESDRLLEDDERA